ncbi:MAG: DUF3604 domain-containing protein [Gammaproteobacteria bacterium]|nr:DUF3604 domain-containing protein [Gammaproteobacteria bacterium]
MKASTLVLAGLAALALAACAPEPADAPDDGGPAAAVDAVGEAPLPEPNPLRDAYFGDLHVHTRYSMDAYMLGTRDNPDAAYRFARGAPMTHASGFEMRLADPLDFYAVTDHAMFLGMFSAVNDPTTEVSRRPSSQPFVGMDTPERRAAAGQALVGMVGDRGKVAEFIDDGVVRSTWADIVAAAGRHYEPGRFTTFVGYEYTSMPGMQNLHRNVIFRGAGAPDVPFSMLDSMNPEDLWAWMDRARADGHEVLAIPHNSNGSNGQMFRPEYFDGAALDPAYAEMRMRNEPLVEITQVKGTSETHPLLSPNDEWAGFELLPFRVATWILSNVSGSFVREALIRGVRFEQDQGFNPFRFGFVGGSDTHNASYAGDESDYYGKLATFDATPAQRGSVPLDATAENGPLDVRPCPETVPSAVSGESDETVARIWCGDDADRFAQTDTAFYGAAGLAGVWAEENTRESIYDAFRRRETFATTGPRIRVRFFGGYGLADVMPDAADVVERADAGGVPMGGDIAGRLEGAPTFLLRAARDARSAPLERAQIVKGWVEDGEARERVFDVACSDGGAADPETHRCPNNRATVNLADCSISEDIGASQLAASWQDPAFDPAQHAVYYARVLENPTCRWSTWDALRAGVAPRPDFPATLQERAWTSPIWYTPPQ